MQHAASDGEPPLSAGQPATKKKKTIKKVKKKKKKERFGKLQGNIHSLIWFLIFVYLIRTSPALEQSK